MAFDWKNFFEKRIHSHGPEAPLGGIANSGWKLTFDESVNEHQRAREESGHVIDVSFSLGFSVHLPGGDDSSSVVDVIPGSPAAKAGLAPAMKLIAVNGHRWSPEGLRAALRAAKTASTPIELLVENEDYFQTLSVAYQGGERYPHLERAAGADLLSEIAKRRAPEVAK